MTQTSVIHAGDREVETAWNLAESPEVHRLADRLHAEFGVPVGVLDGVRPSWRAWAGGEAGSDPPDVPRIDHAEGVTILHDDAQPGLVWLALRFPRSAGLSPWLALAAFEASGSDWADRALLAWGTAIEERLARESLANGPPRPAQVAEHLIRRLRVSDPPERFQRRATTALRESLGVEVIAWVPGSAREPVVSAGEVAGFAPEDFRSLTRDPGSEALKICNRPVGKLSTLRRYVVATASAQGDGGWLIAANPIDDRPFSTEADLLSTVASLIGTQKCNARIYSDLKDLLFGVIRSLTAAIDAKDPYTSGHSERVARIAVRIGQELGMPPNEQGDLYLMGLLHDVGKIGVEDVVLKKPGKLTSQEYQQIQAHVRIGVHILSDLKKLHHLLPGVAYHHESLDGSGYPSGLRGEAIPLPARILAVADAFDAMSSSRPYRLRMTTDQIDDVFRKGTGKQWDPRVVNALFACRGDLERIRQKGLGESLHQVISETLGRS